MTQTFDDVVFSVVSDDVEVRDIWIKMENSRLIQRHDRNVLSDAIGKVLTGQAFIVKGSLNGRMLAAIIMSQNGSVGNIIQIYGPGVARKIKDQFFNFLKKGGIEEIYGSSNAKDDAIVNLFGMDKLYTVFKRRL